MTKSSDNYPFPEETKRLADRLKITRWAIVETLVCLGLGLSNQQTAELRTRSVKTVEALSNQASPLLARGLDLDFSPNTTQMAVICHDLLEGRTPSVSKLNGEWPQDLDTTHLKDTCELSPAQADVAALRAKGYNNAGIVELRKSRGDTVSVKTIETHWTTAKAKLLVKIRLEPGEKRSSRWFAIMFHEYLEGRTPKEHVPADTKLPTQS